MGGTGRAAEDDVRERLLLLRWAGDLERGGLATQHRALVSRLRSRGRDRTWPRLHFAGVDIGEVVPRSAGLGNGFGDHGVWWRSVNWRAAGCGADEPLQVAD